ncbi:hypothetical protein OIO90_005129 [Microbotryomycetes sp. JL221]|nr:hypothetical protein OIO90_005129 [Microbotryomycetes sp. JL221]
MRQRQRSTLTRWTVTLALVALWPCAEANHVPLEAINLLKDVPTLPLGLYRHLKAQTTRSQAQASIGGTTRDTQTVFAPTSTRASLRDTYQAHWFDQLVSHDPNVPASPVNATFRQRFWFDATYFKPGGSVFLLDGGEANAHERLPLLEHGILQILAKATGGIGIVFEHRYYGESFPVKNLSTDSMRFLTTMQSLQDSAHFANNIVLPGFEEFNLTAKDTAWIYYGGSYAGAKSAFARSLFPETWWGAIASSAVTTAIEDYWEYYEPIRLSGPRECIKRLERHTALIDKMLGLSNPLITSSLKSFFGLGNVTKDEDFVNALTIPLSTWQARNWDPQVGSELFFEFCDRIEEDGNSDEAEDVPSFWSLMWPKDPRQAFASFATYANYVKMNISTLCPDDVSQDDCFGTDVYQGDSLEDADWRSWSYQVCQEWGYWIGCPPSEDMPSIVSRLLKPEYTSKICRLAFQDGRINTIPARPNVTMINQFGGYNLKYDRLAFIDGDEDPWLYATPHSPHAKRRRDTTNKPFKLIKGGVHHWDENGQSNSTQEPHRIQKIHEQEIDFVKEWLIQWRDRGKWKTGPWHDF